MGAFQRLVKDFGKKHIYLCSLSKDKFVLEI